MRNAKSIRTVVAAALLAATTVAPAEVCNSALQAVAQPTVFPNRSSAAIAWNGAVLAVAKNENNFARSLWVAVYDATLAQLSPDRLVAANTDAGAIALLSDGTGFGLFYRDLQLHLVFQRVTAGGDLIGPPVVIAPGRAVWQNQQFDIAWSAARNGYVIVRSVPQGAERGLWLTTVGLDGTPRSDQLLDLFLSDPVTLRLAVRGDGGLGLVYNRPLPPSEALYLMMIDPANVASGLALVSNAGRNPSLVWSGKEFLLAVTTFSGGHGAIRSIRLNGSGQVIAPEALLIAARGIDIAPLGLIWNDTTSEWALSYSDSVLGFNVYPGEYRLLRLSPALARISDTLFSPDRTKATYGTAYPPIWTGVSYNSSIDRLVSQTEGADSYLARHCPFTASAQSDRGLATIFDSVTFTSQSGGGSPGYSFSWDFGDNSEKGAGPTAKHVFPRIGSYTVTLSATDSAGASAVSATSVQIVTGKHRSARK